MPFALRGRGFAVLSFDLQGQPSCTLIIVDIHDLPESLWLLMKNTIHVSSRNEIFIEINYCYNLNAWIWDPECIT